MLPRVNIFEEVGCAEHGTDVLRYSVAKNDLRHHEGDAVVGANAHEGIGAEDFIACGLGLCIDPCGQIESEQQSAAGRGTGHEKRTARKALLRNLWLIVDCPFRHWNLVSASGGLRCLFDGCADAYIRATSADITRHGRINLGVGRIRITLNKSGG